jgi:uncharacterized protein YcbK (DUF882 family)
MQLTRRSVIKASFAALLCGAAPSFAYASLPASRRLYFHNTHTGERLKTVYWEKGAYIPGALHDIAHVLRDHRNGEVKPIDTSLLDLIELLHRRMRSSRPFEVISGYRSPSSNAMLYANTEGVAYNSLHMYGRAIDIRLPGRATSSLRDAAWNLQLGGVGYYPHSDFVHVDTGTVRRW